jgi:hypothetical protein
MKKPTGAFPPAYNQEVDMVKNLNLLAPLLVIVIIKVKIIVKKR